MGLRILCTRGSRRASWLADNRARFYTWPQLVATAQDGSPHLPRRAWCCLCCFVRAVHAFGGQCSAATWTNDDPWHTSLNGASRVGMAALNPQVLWMSMLTAYFAFLERGGYTVLRPVSKWCRSLQRSTGPRQGLVRDARTRGHLATLVHGL
ncbi:uncharacterized protein LOC144165794 isoform X2 [Haemaphysalis longicornis]